ncbi:crAss001_48 related protein [Loigolactobacillus backii]|uniref:crAss001_48 related protein n=1 Tax=Loigolactobacillus backii TaxID=375175 RepID=UPI0022FD6F7C|nr:hypothetical protein [Loigolactobacillus backii]MDA5386979.1 hypothetical protein [Loigolactobacillus backii]MDA5389517.1 hypothetical protein [Loigolactobacillus backii]
MKNNEETLHDLLVERYELWQKIERLKPVIAIFNNTQQGQLLTRQLKYMCDYQRVLTLRITDLNAEVSSDMSDL